MAETPPEQLPPLQYAALQSRLPFESLSEQESALFADTLRPPANTAQVTKLLLYLRNRILQLWLENPKHQLLVDNAIKQLETPYSQQTDRPLAQKMFLYLERQGYINFGVFERIKMLTPPVKKKILIIGAGIAGIAAAQQLTYFGFEVTVLEARDRVGGRIATYKRNNYIGELGAMVVTGLLGNPIAVLAKQIPNMDLQDVKALCHLFDPTGNKLSPEKDIRVYQEFQRLLEASSYLSKELDFNYVNNQPVALGQALEWLIKLQEKRVKEKQVEHWKSMIELQERMKANQKAMRNLKEHMARMFAAQKDLGEAKSQRTINEEFIFRSKIYDLKQCVKEWENLNEQRVQMEAKLEELEKKPPSDVYLSPQDRQVLDWHFANLESANSATLDDLSLRNWDQDEEFKGDHKIIRNGYTVIPISMSRGLDIRLSTAVKHVRYDKDGVEILAQSTKPSGNGASAPLETFTADAVLCTLPLGVLKQTDSSQGNIVHFVPQLPEWKTAAIAKMGYGNLNKVLLAFDKIFWEPNLPVFGHIGSTTASRGELFTFFTISPKVPVLLAIVSGEAANVMEAVNDDVIVGRCVAVLKGMYGLGNVPQPKDSVVTRWRKDPYARGSFSYVAKGACGQDFDLLAEPVCALPPESKESSASSSSDGSTKQSHLARVYFAGEHTSRKYFSTVHGALLSGLREAARISDHFHGPIV